MNIMDPATREEMQRHGALIDEAAIQGAEWFIAGNTQREKDPVKTQLGVQGNLVPVVRNMTRQQDGLSRLPKGLGYMEADPSKANPRSVFLKPVAIHEDNIVRRKPPVTIEAASIRAAAAGKNERSIDFLRGDTREEWTRASIRSELFEMARSGGRQLTSVDRGRFMAADTGLQLQARSLAHDMRNGVGPKAVPSRNLKRMGLPKDVEKDIAEAAVLMGRDDLEAMSSGGRMSETGMGIAAAFLSGLHDRDTPAFDREATMDLIPHKWIHTALPVDYVTMRDMSKGPARSQLVWRDEVMRIEDSWKTVRGRGPVTGKPLAQVEAEHRKTGGMRILSVAMDKAKALVTGGREKGLLAQADAMPKAIGRTMLLEGPGRRNEGHATRLEGPMRRIGTIGPSTGQPAVLGHVAAYHKLVDARGR
jgi:hypothetical protein